MKTESKSGLRTARRGAALRRARAVPCCLAALTLLLVLSLFLPAAAAAGASQAPPPPTFAPEAAALRESIQGAPPSERIVVRTTRSAAAAPDLRLFGLHGARPLGHDGTYVLEMAEGLRADVAETLDTVRRLPGIVWAEETAPRTACLVPNDPFYASGTGQWSLPRIRLPEAWDQETGCGDVIVAILDTGIDQSRPDFAGRIVSPYNAIQRTAAWGSWTDNMGHGTAVAGVAVAQGNDGQGMAGVAWNVKIMPVKIADQGGSDDAILAEGLYWAVDHGADVINISFAGDQVTRTEADAVRYAVERGVVVVASAGNTYPTAVSYPAALPGVIAVGATARVPSDSRWPQSCAGDALDLVAPGTEILSHSVSSSSGWAIWTGTSFSSPLVAGVAALVRSAEPGLTGDQVLEVLTGSARDMGPAGWDRDFGWGSVDAYAALEKAALVAQGTTTTSTTTTTLPPTTSTTSTTSTTTTSTSTTSTTSTTLPPSTTTTTVPPGIIFFVDVSPESTPYTLQIERLAELGIVSGKSDGLFHPRDDLLRQQFAKMIVRTLAYTVGPEDVCPFTDVMRVSGDLYPYHYVAAAWKRGVTQGTSATNFSPYRPLTRAQLITMVARGASLPEPPPAYQAPFPNFSAVHFPYARRAAYAGLLDGIDGLGTGYDFLAPAGRAEVCALLYELLE